MTVDIEFGGRDDACRLIPEVAAWAPQSTAVKGLHVGDIGWHLRLDDADLDETILAVRMGGTLVAAGIAEPGFVRILTRPDHADDSVLAHAIADVADELEGDELYVDAPAVPAVDPVLRARGWATDPDCWAVLYRPLSAADTAFDAPGVTTLSTAADIADRVAVQFAAFERSTFTVARWRQMAASPAHDPGLEFLARTPDGDPAAGATAWSAGPGRVGILEPVGTHPDHRGLGRGRDVSLAAIAALARAGASGVTVQTPVSNQAAVKTYLSCGLRQVGVTQALMR